MALAPWVPEVLAIFCKKSSLPSFLPCSSNSSRCSFRDLFYLVLGLVPNISLKSNLLWASSLMESCFSCFTVEVLKDFRVVTVARERSRLVPLKAMPTGRPTPLANAAIEIPPVITLM